MLMVYYSPFFCPIRLIVHFYVNFPFLRYLHPMETQSLQPNCLLLSRFRLGRHRQHGHCSEQSHRRK